MSHTTHLDKARRAADNLNNHLSDLLEIAEIPDGHPAETMVEAALASVYDALDEIPKNAESPAIHEHGPLIYPSANRDMRHWPTSDGRTAAQILRGRRASKAITARSVMANPSRCPRRVMTVRQYHAALAEARIEYPSPVTRGEDRSSFVSVMSR